jgi:RNA polymerase sigma factor (TIGR02999 family)
MNPPEKNRLILGIGMEHNSSGELAQITGEVRRADAGAWHLLVGAIYDKLHAVASGFMRGERRGHTLQATALLHEALMKLEIEGKFDQALDRPSLLAAACRAMREILWDHHRRHRSLRRGGNRKRVFLDEALDCVEAQGFDFFQLNEALDQLAALDARKCFVVTSRYFLGMTVPEVAELLGVSNATVHQDWRLARAWLRDQLETVP